MLDYIVHVSICLSSSKFSISVMYDFFIWWFDMKRTYDISSLFLSLCAVVHACVAEAVIRFDCAFHCVRSDSSEFTGWKEKSGSWCSHDWTWVMVGNCQIQKWRTGSLHFNHHIKWSVRRFQQWQVLVVIIWLTVIEFIHAYDSLGLRSFGRVAFQGKQVTSQSHCRNCLLKFPQLCSRSRVWSLRDGIEWQEAPIQGHGRLLTMEAWVILCRCRFIIWIIAIITIAWASHWTLPSCSA